MTKPMFEVFEFNCARCEGLIEIRLDKRMPTGKDIFEIKCTGCDTELLMAARYLDPLPETTAVEPNEAVQAGAEDSQVGSPTADSSPPLPR